MILTLYPNEMKLAVHWSTRHRIDSSADNLKCWWNTFILFSVKSDLSSLILLSNIDCQEDFSITLLLRGSWLVVDQERQAGSWISSWKSALLYIHIKPGEAVGNLGRCIWSRSFVQPGRIHCDADRGRELGRLAALKRSREKLRIEQEWNYWRLYENGSWGSRNKLIFQESKVRLTLTSGYPPKQSGRVVFHLCPSQYTVLSPAIKAPRLHLNLVMKR